MPWVLAALAAASSLLLVYVWRESKKLTLPQPGTPAALAESLAWADGDLSPNGRRVLLVEPSASALLTANVRPDATPFFDAPGDLDEAALGPRLPESPVKEKVSWKLSRAELERVRAGFTPTSREDKWRIVTLRVEGAERVYMLRSWTGAVAWVLELDEHGVRWVWRAAKDALAVPTARAVLEGHCLGEGCVVPAPAELGEDKLRLMVYGVQVAGRRCRAVEPHVTP